MSIVPILYIVAGAALFLSLWLFLTRGVFPKMPQGIAAIPEKLKGCDHLFWPVNGANLTMARWVFKIKSRFPNAEFFRHDQLPHPELDDPMSIVAFPPGTQHPDQTLGFWSPGQRLAIVNPADSEGDFDEFVAGYNDYGPIGQRCSICGQFNNWKEVLRHGS